MRIMLRNTPQKGHTSRSWKRSLGGLKVHRNSKPSRVIAACTATLLIATTSAVHASAETITPAVAFAVVDNNFDGTPDQFASDSLSDAIFTRFKDQRAFVEFDLGSLAGPVIESATITGSLNEAFTFGFGTTPADFQFDLFNANGLADLADFNITGTTLGTVNLDEDFETYALSFDVTAALQSLVDAGATHAGFRGLTPDTNVGQVDMNDLVLEVIAVPEPATAALLTIAGLLLARRRQD